MTWRLPFESLNPWQVQTHVQQHPVTLQDSRARHISSAPQQLGLDRRTSLPVKSATMTLLTVCMKASPTCCNHSGQIMVAVDRGERPETPAGHQLLGGGFVGLPHYQRLMHACWAALPHERPPMEEVTDLPSITSFGTSNWPAMLQQYSKLCRPDSKTSSHTIPPLCR
jgi:hypothetical protein